MSDQPATKADIESVLRMIQQMNERMEQRFENADKRFDSADKRFEAADRRSEALLHLIEQMNERMDQRFEAVGKRFDALDRRLGLMDSRLDRIGEGVSGVQFQLAAVTRWADRLDNDHNAVVATQNAQQLAIDDLAARVARLERQQKSSN